MASGLQTKRRNFYFCVFVRRKKFTVEKTKIFKSQTKPYNNLQTEEKNFSMLTSKEIQFLWSTKKDNKMAFYHINNVCAEKKISLKQTLV